MPGQSGRPAIRCLQRGPQAGSPAERAPARLLRIPACRPGHSVSPPTAKMGRRTGLSAVGMNQPQPRGTHGPGNRPAEARQFGSTATPPDYRGSAVFGPCGSSRQPSTAGWVQSCPAGACRRVPRWLPIRPMRRAKLPVFFRSSFLAGALRTAISSALMQWNNMPHRPGAGARAGSSTGPDSAAGRGARGPAPARATAPGRAGTLHRCRADGREHGRCRARRGRSARRRIGVWNEEA